MSDLYHDRMLCSLTRLLPLFAFLCLPLIVQGQVIGPVRIGSQTDVDFYESLISSKSETSIDGDLIISPDDPADRITDFEGLDQIISITGDLVIVNYSADDLYDPLSLLTSLSTVNNLIIGEPDSSNVFPGTFEGGELSSTISTISGDLIVENNPNLVSLAFLSPVSIIGSARAENNSTFGLFGSSLPENTISIGESLELINNGFQNLTGLAYLQSVGQNITLRGNPALVSLGDFASPSVLSGTFTIEDNDDLTDLGALSVLTQAAALIITGNDELATLNDFTGLSTLTNSLTITNNVLLADCSQLPCQTTVNGQDFDTTNPNVTVSGNTGDCADKAAIRAATNNDSYPCVQAAVLPVELMTFTGAFRRDRVALSWETATETDNSHFIVERSTNGFTFSAIGEVEGQGSSSVNVLYSYEDAKYTQGQNYYRLRQVDYDGSESVSNVITVQVEGAATALKIAPNPVAAGQASQIVLPDNFSNMVAVEVFTADGQRVVNRSYEATAKVELPTQDLPTGMYFVRLSDGATSVTDRLIVR
ncbi:T9SS type A sorting domain-containing protein [Lewinella sp. IMCC34191]|uniref:T9SS type A sorting domain-containing protein n=1 Tax=Lewinella sp. IMCC34191 TaxID=2259172 RepID=UPI0013007EEB|nr:T9SS type A sorting domain-containing protein [Lewinella sp. IMCC34191]